MVENKSPGGRKPPANSRKPGRAESSKPAPAGLQEHIGVQLKAMYEDVVAQPIPGRLLDLLSRLDEQARDK
jgi:hypothetical protein